MKQETLEIEGKVYTISELKYKDVTSIGDISKEEAGKKLMILSTGITDEEYNELSMKDGVSVMKVINKLNGLEDFQMPVQS